MLCTVECLVYEQSMMVRLFSEMLRSTTAEIAQSNNESRVKIWIVFLERTLRRQWFDHGGEGERTKLPDPFGAVWGSRS